MKDAFISDDARPFIEPLLVIVAIALDLFVGKTGFTTLFGWWLFVVTLIWIIPLSVCSTLVFVYGKEYCRTQYPEITKRMDSHRAFILTLFFGVFLHYWWRWL